MCNWWANKCHGRIAVPDFCLTSSQSKMWMMTLPNCSSSQLEVFNFGPRPSWSTLSNITKDCISNPSLAGSNSDFVIACNVFSFLSYLSFGPRMLYLKRRLNINCCIRGFYLLWKLLATCLFSLPKKANNNVNAL